MRDGKEIQFRIPMEVNATQIAKKPRRVPYQLTEPLKKRLEERNYRACTSTISHHLVFTTRSITQTQEFKRYPLMSRPKDDHQINVAHTTGSIISPITEDFIRKFKDCKVFSKLDPN